MALGNIIFLHVLFFSVILKYLDIEHHPVYVLIISIHVYGSHSYSVCQSFHFISVFCRTVHLLLETILGILVNTLFPYGMEEE